MRHQFAVPLLALIALLSLGGCTAQREQRRLVPADRSGTIDRKAPFLKAHLRDGRVYVLSDWSVDEAARSVSGVGQLLTPARTVASSGPFTVALDSVALFETNRVGLSPSVAAMAVVTAVSAAVTVSCLANPKACFGSCPTFYVGADRTHIRAEGFSSSIAPSLEALDVDQLPGARAGADGTLNLWMTNEALETHVVRSVELWAVPRPVGGRAFATADGRFYPAPQTVAPISAVGPEGDVTELLTRLDQRERLSLADSLDLSTKETLTLTFPIDALGAADTLGLAITARQTLMSTYLLYQTLGFLGSQAGAALAALERGDRTAYSKMRVGFGDLLGGVDAEIETAGGWVAVGEVYETGPLATDTHLLRFPRSLLPAGRTARVRLRLSKGNWRLDAVELVRLGPAVAPIQLAPVEVTRGGRPDADGLARLTDPARTLVALPGDAYGLTYRVPAGEHELFVASKGYYLEWMREQWLKEEDPDAAAMVMFSPAEALRVLAPGFKRIEPGMEDAFWRSRYVRP